MAGLAFFFLLPRDEPARPGKGGRPDRAPAEQARYAAPLRRPAPAELPERRERSPTAEPAPLTSASSAPDDLAAEVVGPHPDDPHPPGALPHPITPEHERIRYENQLIQGLNDAIDLRDVPRIRQLVAEYEKAEPEDVHSLQAGYTIIADCIEHPGPASRAAAQHYWNTERHSILRRYVRRHCGLELPR